ncbi:hypothetical protein B7486_74395, partial [cyanobacterium TDX16]
VDPRASFRPVDAAADERFAYEARVDPDAEPAKEQPELTLARFSGGAAFTFHRMKPTGAGR